MNVTYRPIDAWPADADRPLFGGYRSSPFSAGWGKTLALLDRELYHLGAKDIVIQLAVREAEIRLDGMPRSRAQTDHPGVILAFDTTEHGPLKYATAVFPHWTENLRAIALGLEALRKLDRYGITSRGQQYTGWKALPAGDGLSPDRGRVLIREHGGEREALMATHPDKGGSARDFADVQAARTA